jgi:hypothetical protein
LEQYLERWVDLSLLRLDLLLLFGDFFFETCSLDSEGITVSISSLEILNNEGNESCVFILEI